MPLYTTKRASIPEPARPWEVPTWAAAMAAGYHSVSPLRSPAGINFPPGARHEAQRELTPYRLQLDGQHLATEGGLVVPLTRKRARGDPCEVPQALSKVRAQAPAAGPEEKSHPNASRGMVQTSPIHLKTPGKRCAQIPLENALKPRKKARWSPFRDHHKSVQQGHLGVSKRLCLPATPPVTGKTPTPEQGIHPQPAQTRPLLETVRACTDARRAPSKPAPRKPLRMVFTRLHQDCWSSSFLAPPSFHPPEKSALPGQGPLVIQKSEGHFGHVPVSVLHDDLQVSSSSEDSESESETAHGL